MRGLAAVFVPLAIFGEGSNFAVAVFDGFKIRISRVDHVFTRSAFSGRNIGQQRRARRDQILHPVGAEIARQHVLDFRDLTIDHFQPQRDDQRTAILFHDAVEADLVGCGIDGVDLEGTRGFGSANP